MGEWTNKKVISLIKMYRDRPALWNGKHEHYKDKNFRQSELLQIGACLGETKEEIERKIKNLLSHFSRELKKEGKSSKCGTIASYKSKWFAYEAMMFLKGKNKQKNTHSEEEINSSDEDDSSEDPLQIYVAQEESKKIDNDKTTKIISSENIPAKKRKVDEMSEEYNTLTKNEPDMFPKDEYSIFGELVAIKLRHLPSDYAKIVVQHIINTTLFHAQMGKYNNPPDLHNSSTSTGPQPDPYDYYMSNHLQEILPKISSTQPPSLQPYQHSTSSSESFVSESQPLMPTKTEALSDIE